jgi:hypothetical protein
MKPAEDNFCMPASPVFRLARAVIFAVVCVTLATAGHAMASHATVPAVAVAAGLLLLTGMAVVLAGSERSLATILGGLLGGQFMLHVLFAAAQHGQTMTHGHAVPASSGGATMVLSHAGAAVVAAWWLRRGERAIWRSARTLARRAAATVLRPVAALLAGPPSPPPRRRPAVKTAPEVAPTCVALRHIRMRRGPPSPSRTLA